MDVNLCGLGALKAWADNPYEQTYDRLMETGGAHIVLRIDTKNPIELGDFVAAFSSLASQYDKFMRENYPDLAPEAQIFVKEIRQGSIIAELLPLIPFAALGLPYVTDVIDQVNAVNDFVDRYSSKIKAFLGPRKAEITTKSELKDMMGAVAAIAKDPNANATLETVVFEDGERKVRAALTFTTREAVGALRRIEDQQQLLEKKSAADYERVLMVFTQANINDSPVGRRTGEWVAVEAISDKPLPLVYASDLAEQRIKHVIREEDDNLFKTGFIVDVNVATKGGRPVAYRVTNLHQVIDLPDEGGGG